MTEQTITGYRIPVIAAPLGQIWASLGWLRFGLAVIVTTYHLRSFFADTVTLWDPARIVGSFNGVAAVVSFLLVSGFSICHSLVQSPKGYIRRRFIRVYPLYIVAIVFSVLVGSYWTPSGGAGGVPRQFGDSNGFQIVVNAMLLQGAFAKPLFNNDPLWTLSLEWWLYMLAPLIVLLKPKHLTCLLVALAIGNLSWILVGPSFKYYTHTLAFANLWFLGAFWVLGFWYYLNRKEPFAPLVIVLSVWFLTGINRDSLDGNYQVTLVLSCLCLIVGDRIPWPDQMNRLGRFLGNVSYPLYLIHMPLFALLYRFESLQSAWLMTTLAIVAAILAHMLIENPLRSIFSKIWKSGKAEVQANRCRVGPTLGHQTRSTAN